MRLQRRLSVLVLVGLATIVTVVAIAARPVPLGAEERPAEVDTIGTIAYRAWPGAGGNPSTQAWNVVLGTGNCCESQVRVGDDGTIYDFGGNKLHLSRDGGRAWSLVDTNLVLGAEGDVALAPNGDVLAMTWDPYTGDRIVAVRYDASEEVWQQQEVLLNTPFYDRPWIVVVPGTDNDSGYRVVMRSGYAFNPGYLVSEDGLTYRVAQRITATRELLRPLAPGPWDGAARAQAHRRADMIPLGDGRLLLDADLSMGCGAELHVLEIDGVFSCAGDSVHPLAGWDVIDDRGTLYAVRFSPTGELRLDVSRTHGATSTSLALPMMQMQVRGDGAIDIKTTASGDRVVVAAHAEGPEGNSHVLVWDLRRTGSTYQVSRVLELGRGDASFSTNASGDTRLDFPSVGILPDGRLVASYRDAELGEMALAIEAR